MNYNDVTVVIPTLNEEKNIFILIKTLKKYYKDIHILVVDDGSKDNTQKIVRKTKTAVLLDRSKKEIKGLSISILEGIKLSKTGYIVVMDSDLQHPPKKIGEIVAKLRAGDDIVIATRKTIKKWTFSRRAISRMANILGRIRLIFNGIYVKDPMSGFFGLKKQLINRISKYEHRFEKRGYKILFDILKYCGNVKVGLVYYTFSDRKYGTSKIAKRHIISYLKALFK